jgi:hypothetical protein
MGQPVDACPVPTGACAGANVVGHLTSVAGVVHGLFTDPDGAHCSIKTRFSLGERLLVGFNAPVNNNHL